MKVAQHKIHHTFFEAVALGILCNLMVCLAVWMAFGARSATDKVMVMLLPSPCSWPPVLSTALQTCL